jgi:hypothetical protein
MQGAEAYGPGVLKARVGGGSCWCHPAASDLRTAFGKPAGDVIHVLVGERDAVQRTARNPTGNRRIGRRRGGQRFLDFHTDEGIEDWLPALDARE